MCQFWITELDFSCLIKHPHQVLFQPSHNNQFKDNTLWNFLMQTKYIIPFNQNLLSIWLFWRRFNWRDLYTRVVQSLCIRILERIHVITRTNYSQATVIIIWYNQTLLTLDYWDDIMPQFIVFSLKKSWFNQAVVLKMI